jgi:hypothetical protein
MDSNDAFNHITFRGRSFDPQIPETDIMVHFKCSVLEDNCSLVQDVGCTQEQDKILCHGVLLGKNACSFCPIAYLLILLYS